MGQDGTILKRIHFICVELAAEARNINRPLLATLLEMAAAEVRLNLSEEEEVASDETPAERKRRTTSDGGGDGAAPRSKPEQG